MTLNELAKKLNEIFKFDFMTVSNYSYDTIIDMNGNIGTRYEPHFQLWQAQTKEVVSFDEETGEWGDYEDKGWSVILELGDIRDFVDIDLSEYMVDGTIDYSRCIVDLSEYKED